LIAIRPLSGSPPPLGFSGFLFVILPSSYKPPVSAPFFDLLFRMEFPAQFFLSLLPVQFCTLNKCPIHLFPLLPKVSDLSARRSPLRNFLRFLPFLHWEGPGRRIPVWWFPRLPLSLFILNNPSIPVGPICTRSLVHSMPTPAYKGSPTSQNITMMMSYPFRGVHSMSFPQFF